MNRIVSNPARVDNADVLEAHVRDDRALIVRETRALTHDSSDEDEVSTLGYLIETRTGDAASHLALARRHGEGHNQWPSWSGSIS